jgi:hypothetical protein
MSKLGKVRTAEVLSMLSPALRELNTLRDKNSILKCELAFAKSQVTAPATLVAVISTPCRPGEIVSWLFMLNATDFALLTS